MFEAWHDIQYLAIVWLFNLNRAHKNPEAGPFIRFLFRPRAILVAAYVAVCLVFGSLTHTWRLFENPLFARFGVAFVIGTALLHYYLDGFIWKIREKETRQALGVSEAQGAATIYSQPSALWVRHAVLWLLFVGPTAFFLFTESQGHARPRLEVFENVVGAFPDSAHAHYQLAKELQDMGRLREANVHFEQALAIRPDFFDAHKYLGVSLADQRNLSAARLHFEQALKLEPRNAELHNNLGIILDEQGNLENAKKHLEVAVSLAPEYVLGHTNLGFVLTKLGESERAVEHLEKALSLDADQYLAHNSLGEVLMSQEKFSEARVHFEQALRIDPEFSAARRNLSTLDAKFPAAAPR
jgi:tetratricopeptide (TPR) repeat protein